MWDCVGSLLLVQMYGHFVKPTAPSLVSIAVIGLTLFEDEGSSRLRNVGSCHLNHITVITKSVASKDSRTRAHMYECVCVRACPGCKCGASGIMDVHVGPDGLCR
jgi:hypothetical protein